MDRVDRAGDVEYLGALEEERPQLGIEEREPLVHLYLRAVRFDLREVGIQREVRGQIRRDAVLEIDASLRCGVAGDEIAGGGIDRAELDGGEGWQNLEVAAGRQSRQPFQHTHLRQKACNAAGDGRPDDRLVLPADAAGDLQSPAVRRVAVPLRIPQALERNGHLRREPVLDHAPAGREQGVPGPVSARQSPPAPASAPAAESAAPAARADYGVALDAVRVHREDVRALLIEKRVEVDGDEVVAKRLVAVGTIRADRVRLRVPRAEAEVDGGAVVRQIHLGRLGRRRAVERLELNEFGDRNRVGPRVVVQTAVDGGRRAHADRPHHRPAGQHPGFHREVEGRFRVADRHLAVHQFPDGRLRRRVRRRRTEAGLRQGVRGQADAQAHGQGHAAYPRRRSRL